MLIDVDFILKKYKELNFSPTKELLCELHKFVQGFNKYAIINTKPIVEVKMIENHDEPGVFLKWSSHYDDNNIEIGTNDFCVGYIDQQFDKVMIFESPLEFIPLDNDENGNEIYHSTDFDVLNCHFKLFNNYDKIQEL